MISASRPAVEETARMKRAKRAQDTRSQDSDPAFLRPHKEQKKDDLHYSDVAVRGEGSQVDVKSAVFRPNWGFRKQDSVVGSTKHAIDWSLNSLTSPDYRDFVVNGGIGEDESLGCQAIASINAHFQGAIHRARSWERKSKEYETESQQRGLYIHQLEGQLREGSERLADVQAELVAARADIEKEKEKAVDEYLDSAEYKKIMEHHDDTLFSVQYSQGWDDAVKAVLERHPGLFDPTELPSPYAPTVLPIEPTSSDELFGVGDALVQEHAAAVTAAETSSKGKGKEVEGDSEDTTHTSPTPSPKDKGAATVSTARAPGGDEEDDAASKEV